MLLTGLGLALTGLVAIPVIAEVRGLLDDRADDRAKAGVEQALLDAASSCATQALGQVTEPILEGRPSHQAPAMLRGPMMTCLEVSGDSVERGSDWVLQCEPLGCSAFADSASEPRRLRLGFSFEGFLDQALQQAGRPGWNRFLDPGELTSAAEIRDDGER